MRIAIISDTHFGDPDCTLVAPSNGGFVIGPKYAELRDILLSGKLDYLVALGDIFDFSITSYAKAYAAGQVFFDQLRADNFTGSVIYIPGNHDADFWHTVEHQVNVLMQVAENKPPREFRWSVPGVLDFDPPGGAEIKFVLPGVGTRNGEYGGLFLDNITHGIGFVVAYPNMYLKTANETILVTHGHYLEPYWSILSEWLPQITGPDLDIGVDLDIKELVSINFPFNQLACSGIGQAGVLTDLIQKVQREVKGKQFARVDRYLKNLKKTIDRQTDFTFWKEILADILTDALLDAVSTGVKESNSSRFDELFTSDPEVQRRFKRYYGSSLIEIIELQRNYQLDLGIPTRLIFGHTHEPISWSAPRPPKTLIGSTTVLWHNSGGWVTKKENGQDVFVGAEVFVCDEINGMSSVSVR